MKRQIDHNGVALVDKANLARAQAIVALKHGARDLSLAKTPEEEAAAIARCRLAMNALEAKSD